MRNPRRIAGWVVATVAVFLSVAAGASAQAPAGAPVVRLRLTGVVDPFIASYISHEIGVANDQSAAAVLLLIDTPGGLDSSMREIVKAIEGSGVPVICYVSPSGARAASAGTFIMIGCPVAAMAPGTNIGAAHPVGVSGAIEEQKVLDDAVAYIRSLAELRGRNADWAQQAVTDSVSITAERALQIDVIDLIEPTDRALLDAVDGRPVAVAGGAQVTVLTATAPIVDRSMGIGATILHTILSPDFAFIFFYLGIGLIIVELLHPGLSIPGILGVLSLLAAFVAFGELPVQLIGVSLLLASAVFFLLELKHPGLGVFTGGGVVTLVLGGLTLFNPSVPNARVSPWLIAVVAGLLVVFFATVVTAVLKARHMPRPDDAGGEVVGGLGVVVRDLDPQGVIRVGSEEWSARSGAGPLTQGTRVRVVGRSGLRLDVEEIEEHAPAGHGEGRES